MIAGGILWKKGTTQGAIASFLIGIACVIVNKMGLQMPMASIFPILPSLIAYVAVSLMTQPKKAEPFCRCERKQGKDKTHPIAPQPRPATVPAASSPAKRNLDQEISTT